MFKCDRCGSCCKSIGGVDLYSDLDDGNGICKHLDTKTNLCLIYENRPLKCRIDDAYNKIFKNEISLEQYYELNYECCKSLRRNE